MLTVKPIDELREAIDHMPEDNLKTLVTLALLASEMYTRMKHVPAEHLTFLDELRA
jgi:hypothetical protein